MPRVMPFTAGPIAAPAIAVATWDTDTSQNCCESRITAEAKTVQIPGMTTKRRVQAHHAQQLFALLVDGNEGHGTGRIVVADVEELVAHLAHWSEEAQPKILRCHVAEKIWIEGSILRHKPADQNRRSIAQS
jgi:hypothetical protein